MRVAGSDPPDFRTLGLAQIALVWLGRQASLVKACSLFPASCNRGVRCRRIWRGAGPRLSTPSFQYADASRTLPPGLRFWGPRLLDRFTSALRVLCGSALPSTSCPVAALLPAKSDRVGKPSPMPFLTSLLCSPHSISQLSHRDSFCDSPRRHHDSFADVTIGSLSLGSDGDRRYSTGPEPPGRLFTRDI